MIERDTGGGNEQSHNTAHRGEMLAERLNTTDFRYHQAVISGVLHGISGASMLADLPPINQPTTNAIATLTYTATTWLLD